MRRLLILGGGTAGTIVANRLRRQLGVTEWQITVIDQDNQHVYQPGLLFLPFGRYQTADVIKSRRRYLADGVELLISEIGQVDPDACTVELIDGRQLGYDYLVIATGATPRPDQTPGTLGKLWRSEVFDFYTVPGAAALARALREFDHGKLVVHVTDMPIKCPVAPLEFAFLAESYLRRRGMRDRVEIEYVTPLSGAFTQPVASALLGSMLDERKISLQSDFLVERIDEDTRTLVSYDEREVAFDLLVTVPLNMGAEYIARSGLGDELNFVQVDKHSLQSTAYANIFALGDAASLPTSKAGSVAHFAAEILVGNFRQLIAGQAMTGSFDGHANCFVECGDGKGMLIDFNYDTEPLPGAFPIPGVGPFPLLRESLRNHWGKLGFRWVYWHMLLPGHPIPLPGHMTMAGKNRPANAGEAS